MKTGSVMKLLNAGKQFTKKHAPELMTALGIGSMAVAVGSAIISTPKAIANVEEAEREKGEPLTKVEVVKATWKCYIPTAASFAVGAGCLIGANSINTRRVAMWAGAYTISETKLSDLKHAIEETVDEEKATEIKNKATKKRIERKLEDAPITAPIVGSGKVLCWEPITEKPFVFDKVSIREAALNIKDRLHAFNTATLNDFISEMIDLGAVGLKESSLIGDRLGWNVEKPIDIKFEPIILDSGEPALSIVYLIEPEYDFEKIYKSY